MCIQISIWQSVFHPKSVSPSSHKAGPYFNNTGLEKVRESQKDNLLNTKQAGQKCLSEQCNDLSSMEHDKEVPSQAAQSVGFLLRAM